MVHILVVSHTCINPFIYCWMNRRVRYGFMDVMGEKLANDFVDASGPMASFEQPKDCIVAHLISAPWW